MLPVKSSKQLSQIKPVFVKRPTRRQLPSSAIFIIPTCISDRIYQDLLSAQTEPATMSESQKEHNGSTPLPVYIYAANLFLPGPPENLPHQRCVLRDLIALLLIHPDDHCIRRLNVRKRMLKRGLHLRRALNLPSRGENFVHETRLPRRAHRLEHPRWITLEIHLAQWHLAIRHLLQ